MTLAGSVGIAPQDIEDCTGGEVLAIRQGYRDKMDEIWRMAYMIGAFAVIGPHLQHKSVNEMYSNLIQLAFPDNPNIKKKSPTEILKELEEQNKILENGKDTSGNK